MKKLLPWLLSLAIIMVGFFTINNAAQENQRAQVNAPLIQLAQEEANLRDKADIARPILGTYSEVNISQSLMPFVVTYDKKGKPIDGSGFVDGKLPKIDLDTLEKSKDKTYNAVTWEPKKDVSVAAVIVEAKDYYVLSGANQREAAKSHSKILQNVLIGFIISTMLLGAIFVVSNMNEEY